MNLLTVYSTWKKKINLAQEFFILSKMQNQKSKIDVVNELLEACILAYPISSFVISLYKQYVERGWLTKKQLQGIYDKASKIENLPPGKLAAVEALIKKMPTRYKSDKPLAKPLYEKDKTTGELIGQILGKYPQHKGVLFIRAKFENNEPLSPTEIADLKKIKQHIDSRK